MILRFIRYESHCWSSGELASLCFELTNRYKSSAIFYSRSSGWSLNIIVSWR